MVLSMAAPLDRPRLTASGGAAVMGERDAGRCGRCGGRLTATHMLLATYPLDRDGNWRASRCGFSEDIVVACSACGSVPTGSVHRATSRCYFVAGQGEQRAPRPIGAA